MFTLLDMALGKVLHDQGEAVAREEDAYVKETGQLVPDRKLGEDVQTFDDEDLVSVFISRKGSIKVDKRPQKTEKRFLSC